MTAQTDKTNNKSFRIRGRVFFGTLVISGLMLGIGGWAATAQLSSAVIAPGSVVVNNNVKKIQHRDGGIVSKIHVKNGDHVRAGQALIELDETQLKSQLGVINAQLMALLARQSRLNAEIMNSNTMMYPDALSEPTEDVQQIIDGERRLFIQTRQNIISQKEQLNLQIEQLNEEINGINAQSDSKQAQLDLMQKELEQAQNLYANNLTSVNRLYALQREAKRLSGEFGGLQSQAARSRGKISEIRSQIISVEHQASLQAQRELRTTEAKLAELKERKIAASDRLRRTKLLAPQDGLIHELAVHTIGGIISPAETVIVIVPRNDRLTVEARIAPVDIDQVAIGGTANLRFSAFNQQTTPELKGRIVQVAADVTTDPKTSQKYYLGRIEIAEESKSELGKLDLLPGMPVEIFISTGSRTALSYLSKPITDQIHRAFREE